MSYNLQITFVVLKTMKTCFSKVFSKIFLGQYSRESELDPSRLVGFNSKRNVNCLTIYLDPVASGLRGPTPRLRASVYNVVTEITETETNCQLD